MAYSPVRKWYYISKVSFLLVLAVIVLGLFEKWRGGQRAASATDPLEQKRERGLKDEVRIIPGSGEGRVAYLREDQKLGMKSEKKLAMNVHSSVRTDYKRILRAVQSDGPKSERSAPPIVDSIADTGEAFGYCAERAEHYARKRDSDRASYIDAAKEFTYCANVAHSVKTIAKNCALKVNHVMLRRGSISMRSAPALPPVVQSVADAAEAFTYCAAMAEHYANEEDGMRTNVDAAIDFSNCANIANTVKASVANYDLSGACSNITRMMHREKVSDLTITVTTMSTTPPKTSPKKSTTPPTTPKPTTICGSGYEYSNVTKHCYKVHNERLHWLDARRACWVEGAELAVGDSPEEMRVLGNLANRTGVLYFIGLYKDSDHIWKTVTGEDITEVAGSWWEDLPEDNDWRFGATSASALIAHTDDGELAFICERAPFLDITHAQHYSQVQQSININV